MHTSSSTTVLFKNFSKEITSHMHLNILCNRVHSASTEENTHPHTQKEITQLLMLAESWTFRSVTL